jgi:hypothetical protein
MRRPVLFIHAYRPWRTSSVGVDGHPKELSDFLRCDNRAGMVCVIGDECGVHEFLRVIRSRVLRQSDVLAELNLKRP